MSILSSRHAARLIREKSQGVGSAGCHEPSEFATTSKLPLLHRLPLILPQPYVLEPPISFRFLDVMSPPVSSLLSEPRLHEQKHNCRPLSLTVDAELEVSSAILTAHPSKGSIDKGRLLNSHKHTHTSPSIKTRAHGQV